MKKLNSNAQKLDSHLNNLYLNFSNFLKKNIKKSNFAIGVSGGPDSMCLAYLSKLYSDANKNKFYSLIVDHGVRKNSATEALKVKKELTKHKILSTIFKIKFNDKKNFHSEARDKRYDVMANFCKKKRLKYLVLAHHRDDQIENFYIRLSRGSGLAGLSPIKDRSKYKNVEFLRPFLNYGKQDLLRVAKSKFKFYVKDPSNFDDKYLRSRVRKLKNYLELEGLDHSRLLKTLNNLSSARDALDFYAKKAEKNFFKQNTKAIKISKGLFKEPHEIIFRSLTNFLIRKQKYPPRAKGIERLIFDLSQNNKKKVTLAGYIFQNDHKFVTVTKEIRKKG